MTDTTLPTAGLPTLVLHGVAERDPRERVLMFFNKRSDLDDFVEALPGSYTATIVLGVNYDALQIITTEELITNSDDLDSDSDACGRWGCKECYPGEDGDDPMPNSHMSWVSSDKRASVGVFIISDDYDSKYLVGYRFLLDGRTICKGDDLRVPDFGNHFVLAESLQALAGFITAWDEAMNFPWIAGSEGPENINLFPDTLSPWLPYADEFHLDVMEQI
jgi:hypothetical protein